MSSTTSAPTCYELEKRFQITVTVSADAGIGGQVPFVIEKGEQVHSLEQARALAAQWANTVVPLVEPIEEAFVEEEFEGEAAETGDEAVRDEDAAASAHEAAEGAEPAELGENGENGEGGRRRRRRRRRGGRRDDRAEGSAPGVADDGFQAAGGVEEVELGEFDEEESVGEHGARDEARDDDAREEGAREDGARGQSDSDGERRRRRRGRRGGRRNRREEGERGFTPPEHGASPIDEEVIAAAADFGGPPVEQIPHAVGEYAAAGAEPDRAQEAFASQAFEAPASEARASEVQMSEKVARVPEPRVSERRSRASSPQPLPDAAPAPAAASAPTAPEPTAPPPRRRSTVREPAPFLAGGGSAPAAETAAPAPMAVEPAPAPSTPAEPPSAEPGAPRRVGWWGKKLFGEKT